MVVSVDALEMCKDTLLTDCPPLGPDPKVQVHCMSVGFDTLITVTSHTKAIIAESRIIAKASTNKVRVKLKLELRQLLW